MLSGRSPVWIVGRAAVILLISGLAGATLVRLAPGFGSDEQMLDIRLSAESMRALQERHASERNPVAFYALFLGGLFRGDAGQSTLYGRPVSELISERALTTLRAVTAGLAMGWAVAVLLASASALSGGGSTLVAATAVSGTLLSVPSAVLATMCLLLRLSTAVAIAAVVLPRVFPHVYEQLRNNLAASHVLMARARGLRPIRVFLFHVVPPALMPILALGGVSVTLAFGASIPIEALADSPGLGQLAWRAALGRDLPVLVTVTLLLTAITVIVNALADIALARLGRRTA